MLRATQQRKSSALACTKSLTPDMHTHWTAALSPHSTALYPPFCGSTLVHSPALPTHYRAAGAGFLPQAPLPLTLRQWRGAAWQDPTVLASCIGRYCTAARMTALAASQPPSSRLAQDDDPPKHRE